MVVLQGDLLFDLGDVVLGDLGVVAVDDLDELFQSRPAGLDELEEDEDELKADPALETNVLAHRNLSAVGVDGGGFNLQCR